MEDEQENTEENGGPSCVEYEEKTEFENGQTRTSLEHNSFEGIYSLRNV